MRLRVVDFETTGAQGSEVIEAGVVDVERLGRNWTISRPRVRFFKPTEKIDVQAQAVHHITDADLHSAEGSSTLAVESFLMEGPPVDALVAHHAEFERSFLLALKASSWICTAKSSRRAWPQAPGYSNQVLRYWLQLDLDPALALPAHRAGPDAYVTAHILRSLLETETAETLLEWTAQPAVVSFGKHKGKPWGEVPTDYLNWMMGEHSMADRHLARARDELQRRSAEALAEVWP